MCSAPIDAIDSRDVLIETEARPAISRIRGLPTAVADHCLPCLLTTIGGLSGNMARIADVRRLPSQTGARWRTPGRARHADLSPGLERPHKERCRAHEANLFIGRR